MFTANGEAPLVKPTYHNQYYPINNTVQGTKMILIKTDGTAKVYALGGTFTSLVQNNHIFGEDQMSLSPNPSAQGNTITFDYKLPSNIKSADLVIYDNLGKQVKSYKIGSDMDKLLIEAGEFKPGLYYYQVTSGTEVMGTKKVWWLNRQLRPLSREL